MDELTDLLTQLADLMIQQSILSAPYDTQIQQLEVARSDATAHLTFQIDTLKAAIRPLILEQQRTARVKGLTAGYVHKQTWDSEGLQAFATEVPAILQFQRDSSYVTFRQTRLDRSHGQHALPAD